MNILAIETATQAVGCALWASGRPVACFMLAAGRRHAETLMPAIDDLCRRAGLRPADLDGVAVDVGPGLFTGMRVGLATARAIATALGIPAAGVNSLEALAYAQRFRAGLVAPVVDARRSEVFWALYRTGVPAGLVELRPPAVAVPGEVARELVSLGEQVLAVGDGAWRYREALESPQVDWGGLADIWPSPLAVAELGEARLGEARLGRASTGAVLLPEPFYLRQADVKIGWEQMSGTAPSRPG